jgi:5-methylcytosine-specific restriction endonuclease McrA
MNREAVAAIKRRSYLAHFQHERESRRRYFETHREEHYAANRRWQARNPEKVAEYRRHTREKNREVLAERSRNRYYANRESVLARQKEYRLTHAEERAAQKSRYRVEHLAGHAARERNRKARKRAAPGSHTAADIEAQYERQHGLCFWRKVHSDCLVKLGDDYHVDHVVPLALGGSNGPENLVLACPSCNLSKNAKHPMDWAGTLC